MHAASASVPPSSTSLSKKTTSDLIQPTEVSDASTTSHGIRATALSLATPTGNSLQRTSGLTLTAIEAVRLDLADGAKKRVTIITDVVKVTCLLSGLGEPAFKRFTPLV
ncbi:hypothetical protein QCA50_019882 [Cerrena zonata]|uniref:Uncharacterized protein n=1 Tax=Cerrena zonata TaxID=2478898 RepID=A0AAW0F9X9_9APHY